MTLQSTLTHKLLMFRALLGLGLTTLFSLSAYAHSGKAAAGLSKGGRIEQIVNVQPNTTYVLSAWAKCPETNMKDRWLNAFLGVENHGGPRVDTDYFMPDHTRKSLQFKTGPSVKNVTIFFTNQPQAAATVVDDFELIEAPAARR